MSDSQSARGDQNNVGWANQSAVVDFTDSETPHDRVLVVGETRFFVYAGQLSAFSEFFRTMFSSNFKEKDQKEVEIKDVDAEAFYTFLKMFLPYKTNVIIKDNFQVLVEYSHRFLARFPFTMCEEFILANSSKLDAIDLLEMAFKYDWEKLKNAVAELLTKQAYVLCNNCDDGLLSCGHCREVTGLVLNKASILAKQSERIAKLPRDIQLFILKALMERTKKY